MGGTALASRRVGLEEEARVSVGGAEDEGGCVVFEEEGVGSVGFDEEDVGPVGFGEEGGIGNDAELSGISLMLEDNVSRVNSSFSPSIEDSALGSAFCPLEVVSSTTVTLASSSSLMKAP